VRPVATQLSNASILELWEVGVTLSPAQRAVAMASLLEPHTNPAEVSRMPVGQRDAQIMVLRRELFGDGMDCTAECPECGVSVEFRLTLSELLGRQQDAVPTIHVQCGDYAVTARLPTSVDLDEASQPNSEVDAQTRLLHACITDSDLAGRKIPVEELPGDVVQTIVRTMEERDPLALLTLSLDCPDCPCQWEAPFDIAAFLWREIQRWGAALLSEIHMLARAYGWSETEILRLSTTRRRMYLDMVVD
jgi:hypothetical protein